MWRRRGFTLIELLVVIAIIGILAAMLFPVFARARESARKIQCLSNVKNIALGMQMYLTDYDRFPPSEHRYNELLPLLTEAFGRGCEPEQWAVNGANPYLRWPVILDEYIKNRDVWKCPSAFWMMGFDIVFDPGGADGWAHWMANHPFSGWDGQYLVHPCMNYFPTGWGGTVTDSVTQFVEVSYLGIGYTQAEGVFGGSIGTTESNNMDLSLSQVNDSAHFVVCGDSISNDMRSPLQIAFQVCHDKQYGCGADWSNCSFSQQCGIDNAHMKQFWTDPSYRRQSTRHMGGSNLGFADGHARWMSAEAILAEAPHADCPTDDCTYHEGTLEGVGCYSNVIACPDW